MTTGTVSAGRRRRGGSWPVNSAATYRPAVSRRRFRHDNPVAVDLFSGFGGLTQGIEQAGFATIMAANHNRYKVEVHEANHPNVEHWIADLVDPESSDYHSARDLPAADLLVAGVSCVNHTIANTKKAYVQGLSLFDLEDPEFEERVTRSERDRATANCVLHYAAQHHPRLILVECTTELTSWGTAVVGKRKVGDGSTFRWWLQQFDRLGYRHRVLYLNSMFFGVPQSRDRLYIVFWDRILPTPNLDHRPESWCGRCSAVVQAVWTWKTGVPPTGTVRYGKQYNYRCPSCRAEVVPPATPSLHALDLSNLGTRIGDRAKPLAPATLARAERCLTRFAEFPAVLMPAKAGSERRPAVTQGADTDIKGSVRPVAVAIDNFQGTARSVVAPLPTQVGSETMAVVSAGVVPYRKNTRPVTSAEAMPTVTSDQIPGVITASGSVQVNRSIQEQGWRTRPIDKPLRTALGSDSTQGVLFSGWYKQNGSTGTETAAHPMTDPLGTLTSRDTTAILTAEWREMLSELTIEDCYFRMMISSEIGRGCGFDVDFTDHKGTFVVWGSAHDQVDGFGNAVSPPVGQWVAAGLRAVLHGEPVSSEARAVG